MRWWAPAAGVCWGWGWIGWGFLLRSCCVFLGENMSVQSGGSCVYLCDEKGAMREQKSQSSIYSEGGAGVSLALLSVVLFSSSSSDSSSREVPSTCSWRRPERLEEKLMGPPRLQEETVLIEFFFFLSECQTVISTWGGFSECELHGSGLRWLQWHHPAPAAVSCGRRWTVWPPPPPPPADASAASYESLTFPP